jgi:adenine phosphoribosyltransferase
MTPDQIKALVRTIPDFPARGIQFRDITPLIGHGEGFRASIDWLANAAHEAGAQAIAGMEARGFIFGACVAARLGIGFVPVRKGGKLPCETISIDYELEYGVDRLELDPTGVGDGQAVVIVDDLLATGGTARAATLLLRKAGARVNDAVFAMDLPDLKGMTVLAGEGVRTHSLMQFEGD